ncbi:hypothetical protein A6A06_37465 [Streptomyces sp. CB02923]|nr:hypothetical protein A6A06_37465 [Streptomyces sp. CB02923]
MRQVLGPQPGEHILEIGTGTGYTTALLCTLAGDASVTTCEIGPTLADTARHTLTTNGHQPDIVTADGEHGVPHRAPPLPSLTGCVSYSPRERAEVTR